MDDLEITKACALAIGIHLCVHSVAAGRPQLDRPPSEVGKSYRPLHDDAQAMALEDHLIAHGYLHYEGGNRMFYIWPLETCAHKFSADFVDIAGRRYAICLCVASLPPVEHGRKG